MNELELMKTEYFSPLQEDKNIENRSKFFRKFYKFWKCFEIYLVFIFCVIAIVILILLLGYSVNFK
jgi:hypothetical protein